MRSIIIGLDAYDPEVFERLLDRGLVPNLAKFVDKQGYSRFSISNPAQSEVSWTSLATGLNPGGHGIFDFVHRDPLSYTPYVSLLPTKSGLTGTQFVPPFTARTIFDQAVSQGYPAASFWWPATFPARPESPVQTLPGLGTPDIHGKLGVGTLFTEDPAGGNTKGKTAVEQLHARGKNRYSGSLPGPKEKKGDQAREIRLELEVELSGDGEARLKIGDQAIDLVEGQWSPIIEVVFKIGFLYKLHALTRAILTQSAPGIRLYFLPLQLHPLHSPYRYGTPQSFVKKTWESTGPFLTVGWPQDTTALEEGCITDDQFLDLCDSIVSRRERILMNHVTEFKEGILATVFDSLDRIQHMFWRDRQEIIENWYVRLDGIVGRVWDFLEGQGLEKTKLIVVSDHGFTDFSYKVHLNRWLIDQGYLSSDEITPSGSLRQVDWARSRAYALGLNSIYLNLAGREGQGSVDASDLEMELAGLQDKLLAWRGPDGNPVVQQVYQKTEVFQGPYTPYGPDLLVGYSPGYRASSETGLGVWAPESIESNKDHWGADHCVNPSAVSGVLFASQGLQNFPNPTYEDFPTLTLGEKLTSDSPSPPPSFGNRGDEDESVIEERLKSLGYL